MLSRNSIDVRMTMAWLYTLLEDKTACQNQFAGIENKMVLLAELPSGNLQYSKKMRVKNRIMKCICSNDDYSREVIRDCMEKNDRFGTEEKSFH